MTKEQYNEWRNHPATLVFRKFIKDRREAVIKAGTELWLNAPDEFVRQMPTLRGRIDEMFALEDIPFEEIQSFYEAENGSESSQA